MQAVGFADDAYMPYTGFVSKTVEHDHVSLFELFRFQTLSHGFELSGTAWQANLKIPKYKIDKTGTIKTFFWVGTGVMVRGPKVFPGKGDQCIPVDK